MLWMCALSKACMLTAVNPSIVYDLRTVPGEEVICSRCVCADGKLCGRCKRSVLPQLTQPSWHKHAHSGMWTDAKALALMSPETRRVYNRKRTKAARKAARSANMAAARARSLIDLAA